MENARESDESDECGRFSRHRLGGILSRRQVYQGAFPDACRCGNVGRSFALYVAPLAMEIARLLAIPLHVTGTCVKGTKEFAQHFADAQAGAR